MNYPILLLVCSLVILWSAAQIGDLFRKRSRALQEDERQDLSFVVSATLTLLGLIVGFSFSMAISRYDQRKNYEEAEANAIGTEYVRCDLLPPADAARERELLKKYIDQRVLFYVTRDRQQLAQIETQTAQLHAEMWSVVQSAATARPTPVIALAVSGMNDVLNSEGYTQAAWWNRIPIAAWALMALIAIGCNLLTGFNAHRNKAVLFLILPVAVSISFFLIADIDSPTGGVIHVRPQNLVRLAKSLQAN